MPLLDPQRIGLPSLDTASSDNGRADPARAFEAALSHGHAESARGILQSQFLAGIEPAVLGDAFIAQAMHELGSRWLRNQNGVFMEHRATEICLQGIHEALSLVPAPAAQAPVAMGAAPPGDPYLLPSAIAAFVLAAGGWRTTNLGPEMPLEKLGEAALDCGAGLVWVSVSAAQAGHSTEASLRRLAEGLESCGSRLVVGGRALPPAAFHPGFPATACRSMAELAAFARGLGGSMGARPTRSRGNAHNGGRR